MLTEMALQKNPKSYGAWSHRAWAMAAFPNMDWDRELRLCNLLLEQDEPNCKFLVFGLGPFYIIYFCSGNVPN